MGGEELDKLGIAGRLTEVKPLFISLFFVRGLGHNVAVQV